MNSYFHPFMIGGAEWYVYNISRELVKAGNEVTVFTSESYRGKKAPREDEVEGIKVRRIPLRIDWSYRIKLWDGLRDALTREGFDIIHTYDYAQKHSIDALGAAKHMGIGTALTVFDVHSSIPRRWYKRVPMNYLDSYCARRTFPFATRILVRAPNLVQHLPELKGNEGRVRVSPSGVRVESFAKYDGEKFRGKHAIKGAPVVLFLGRLNPLKGPQVLLEVAPTLLRQFPDFAVVFAGPDQSGYRRYLETRAEQLGISSRVYFTGMIDDFEEKMQAYSACDVFALPTTYEGTSQAIFEAMAQAKPVVATRTGGIPYQITDGREGLLVTYGDLGALAEAIAFLLRDTVKAREMGNRAKEKAMGFQYPNLAIGLQSVYEEIVEANGN
ncbi:MAG: glycosyltransferase family 4 protein [Thaumarchaeota archaeon]|nr:glycosyltransferase family 4 protein [Nitrososphaerota archaeon]